MSNGVCEVHVQVAEDVRECRDSIRELASATNGKMDRVHGRIDKLLILAISTLISSTGALIMLIVTLMSKR